MFFQRQIPSLEPNCDKLHVYLQVYSLWTSVRFRPIKISLFTPSILILTPEQQTSFENIVEKGEIARNEQFLLFPQCFPLNQIMFPNWSIYLYLLLNWKSLKLAYEVKVLSGQGLKPFADIIGNRQIYE